MNEICTCIIPYYRERERIFDVLDAVSRCRSITQIICVDDGSQDGTSERIARNYPRAEVIRLKENRGKSSAVARAVPYAKAPLVLLVDADLRNLEPVVIDKAIQRLAGDDGMGMIILKRVNVPFFTKILRLNSLFSGERIVRRRDLISIMKHRPVQYQLEVAINKYMLERNKRVYWMPSQAVSTYKIDKFGFAEGFTREILMLGDIISYAGLVHYLHQLLFFCRERIK